MMNFFSKPGIVTAFFIALILASCSKKEELRINTSNNPQPPPPPPLVLSCDNRAIVNATLIPVGILSSARSDMSVATAGDKILFAGGLLSSNNYSSRVDIFDIATNTWTTGELTQPRSGVAAVVLGKNVFFAGGERGTRFYSSRVDIYNVDSNTWNTTELGNIQNLVSGAAAGNKIVFASGATAHIYDTITRTWKAAPLSERPGEGNCCQAVVGGIAATVIGDSIFFAGGLGEEVHNAIDIYNSGTDTWSTSALQEYRGFAAGISVGSKNYWAGGITFSGSNWSPSSTVEIRDMKTGALSFACTIPRAHFSAVLRNDNIVFFTGYGDDPRNGTHFEIYNVSTNTWSTGILNQKIQGAAIISVNNVIYVAGGTDGSGNNYNKLWKLEF